MNSAPVVRAGSDKVVSLTSAGNVSFALAGTVTDDGLPSGQTVTLRWSKKNGPGNVTFSSATSSATTALCTVAGTYVLTLSASDSALSASDDIQVVVQPYTTVTNKAPVVNAGSDKSTVLSSTGSAVVSLVGSMTDDGLPVGSALSAKWVQVSGPAASTFSSTTTISTNVTIKTAGTYVFTLTGSDSSLSASDSVQIVVSAPAVSFVRRINLNGAGVTIGGATWMSYADALRSGLSCTPSSILTATSNITPSPAVDTSTKSMLNSCIWNSTTFTINQSVPKGNYSVYLWVMENYATNHRSFGVKMEGTTKASAIGAQAKGAWKKYGPYSVTVSDGLLNIDLVKITGEPGLMGLEIIQLSSIAALPYDHAMGTWASMLHR